MDYELQRLDPGKNRRERKQHLYTGLPELHSITVRVTLRGVVMQFH